ncbi:MAG: hypothetical protein LBG91_04305, partial [Treponema sp.]|nr:hypothetical protein [Treponema sp.]
ELTEQGRERLISALIDTDEDVIRSAAAFGSFWQAEDFGGGRDRDGKLRRVRPVETESSSEHLIYSRLKTRYAGTMLESTEQGQFLTLRGYDEKEIKIPLDRDGNIITAEADNAFRSIEFYIFREYEEADRAMHQVLKEAELIGAFSRTLPERSPLALCDYAFALREEMLKAPDPENRSAWIASRENYIESLNDFLFGPAETLLINGYEEVIADENSLKEDGKAKLRTLRDEMIRLFAAMREKYINLAELRAVLKTELAASFCIMGNDDNTEYSALLADALVSGSHIKPAADLYAFLFPACAACIIILIIFWLPPLPLLFSGLGASVLAAAVFGWSFVYTAYWLDPVTAFGSIFAGTFVVFCCKNSIIRTGTRRFRIAYGAAVSGNVLGQLIRAGRPDVSKIVVSEAVVIVIKNITLFTREYRKGAEQAVKSKKQFHIAVKKILFNTGAVIAGYEGDTVLACFGSPLDKTEDPVRKAGALLKELQRAGQDGWRFGMDAGVCAFSWSAETGFFVNGSPAVRARALASKTIHLKVRALITGPVKDKLNPRAEKIGTLYDGNDPFYEFPA